jgi:hypothetical protein
MDDHARITKTWGFRFRAAGGRAANRNNTPVVHVPGGQLRFAKGGRSAGAEVDGTALELARVAHL